MNDTLVGTEELKSVTLIITLHNTHNSGPDKIHQPMVEIYSNSTPNTKTSVFAFLGHLSILRLLMAHPQP